LVPIGKENAPDGLMPASRYELGSPRALTTSSRGCGQCGRRSVAGQIDGLAGPVDAINITVVMRGSSGPPHGRIFAPFFGPIGSSFHILKSQKIGLTPSGKSVI
jgi:hypothetical protein